MEIINKYNVLALNHKVTDLKNIGNFTTNRDVQATVLKKLYSVDGVEEVLYISTCNRVEVWYFGTQDINDEEIKNTIYQGTCFGELHRLKNDFVKFEGDIALLHMVNVACSLNSIVIGEREIFGQLRFSFHLGKKSGTAGRFLGFAMRKITEISKGVYSKTKIANQKVSVASIACQELRKFVPEPENVSMCLVGAGETIQLVSKYLSNHDFKRITNFNRSAENQKKVKEILDDVICYPLKEMSSFISKSNLIITCTGTNKSIIEASFFNESENYVVLDLAIPSDCTEEVKQLSNVNFIGIEDIKNIAKNNVSTRLEGLNEASLIAFEGWENLLVFLKEREIMEENQIVFSEISNLFNDSKMLVLTEGLNVRDQDRIRLVLNYVKKKLTKIPVVLTKTILLE